MQPIIQKSFHKLALLACAALLAACSSTPTNQQVGTAVGAVGGGAVGNVIFGGTAATIGGAAVGAVVGSEVGKRTR